MRIAVAGATGYIGTLTVANLQWEGHEVVRMSRSLGVDLVSGQGLDEALVGVDVVVDVTSSAAAGVEETVTFFGTATANLLAAEQKAGVKHHVLLSIAHLHSFAGNAHYAGKKEQERLVEAGPVPWTIVPATQFHDFPAMVAGWTAQDGVAPIQPMLIQPIAPADVAAVLAEVAVGAPAGRHVDVAGPEAQDMVDMARRTFEARGQAIKLVPTWDGPIFGVEMAGSGLLPGPDARILPTTFDEWLDQERKAAAER